MLKIYFFARKTSYDTYDPWLETSAHTVRGVIDRLVQIHGKDMIQTYLRYIAEGNAKIQYTHVYYNIYVSDDDQTLNEIYQSYGVKR